MAVKVLMLVIFCGDDCCRLVLRHQARRWTASFWEEEMSGRGFRRLPMGLLIFRRYLRRICRTVRLEIRSCFDMDRHWKCSDRQSSCLEWCRTPDARIMTKSLHAATMPAFLRKDITQVPENRGVGYYFRFSCSLYSIGLQTACPSFSIWPLIFHTSGVLSEWQF